MDVHLGSWAAEQLICTLVAVIVVPATHGDDGIPNTAVVKRVLAEAVEVLIVEASAEELDCPDAARILVTGKDIAELGRLLAVVDGGTGDRCLCRGWPTILVFDASGQEFARWSLHHQAFIGGLGSCDAKLRDGVGLSDWLAEQGLTRSREIQQMLARYAAEDEERRVRWVEAAPPVLVEAAEAASRRETGAEEVLADLVGRRFPDACERIRVLVAWAGFPPRHTTTMGGTPWYELAPERMLLAEKAESVFAALTATSLTSAQLDGSAEFFTSLEWAASQRADIPEALRSLLIEHVTATGTDSMKFRMRHGYGAERNPDAD